MEKICEKMVFKPAFPYIDDGNVHGVLSKFNPGDRILKAGTQLIFWAGKNAAPDKRSAVSSLHFEPVPEVQWRAIFKIKPKNDAKTSFPIRA